MSILNVGIPQKSDDDKFKDAFKYIDLLFTHFPDHGDFDIYDTIFKATNDKIVIRELLDCQDQVKAILNEYKYVDKGTFNSQMKLVQKGRDAKKVGGHHIYQAQEEEKQARSSEKESLEIQKLRDDVLDYQEKLGRERKHYKIAIAIAAIEAIGLLLSLLLNRN
jgi:hypothetical protein